MRVLSEKFDIMSVENKYLKDRIKELEQKSYHERITNRKAKIPTSPGFSPDSTDFNMNCKNYSKYCNDSQYHN